MTADNEDIVPITGSGAVHQIPPLSMTTSLGEARDYVRDNLEEGLLCPCCEQYAKVYRRRINKGQAQSLIRLYRLGAQAQNGWVHVRDLGAASREEGKLVHWGLVEEGGKRADGGRGGWWRLTANGRAFVEGRIGVAKYVYLYNARLLRVDNSEYVTIHDALGEPFLLTDLSSS